MKTPDRPPDRTSTAPGPRGTTWAVHEYWGETPREVGWPHAAQAIIRWIKPEAQRILERDRAAEEAKG